MPQRKSRPELEGLPFEQEFREFSLGVDARCLVGWGFIRTRDWQELSARAHAAGLPIEVGEPPASSGPIRDESREVALLRPDGASYRDFVATTLTGDYGSAYPDALRRAQAAAAGGEDGPPAHYLRLLESGETHGLTQWMIRDGRGGVVEHPRGLAEAQAWLASLRDRGTRDGLRVHGELMYDLEYLEFWPRASLCRPDGTTCRELRRQRYETDWAELRAGVKPIT